MTQYYGKKHVYWAAVQKDINFLFKVFVIQLTFHFIAFKNVLVHLQLLIID